MAHYDRCTVCLKRPRVVDSVLCATCGRRTLQASLIRLQGRTAPAADPIGAPDQRHRRHHAAG